MKQFKWSKSRPTKGLSFPTSREGLSLTFIPAPYNYVLMFGGISNGRLNDIMIYNIADQSWRLQETKGRQPAPRCYHAAFFDSECDSMFFYGGQGDKGRSLSDFYILNLQTFNWKRLFLLEVPQSRHLHTINDIGNFDREKIIFGGACLPENQLLNDVWVFNYKQVVFTGTLPELPGAQCVLKQTKGDAPSGRKGHSAIVYKNQLIVFGGKTEDQEENTSEVYSLALDNYTWKRIQTIGKPPSPRAFFCFTLFGGDKLFLFGGIENASNKILNETYMLQLGDNYWSAPFTAGQMPTPRYHCGCCLIEQKNEIQQQIMIMGGLEKTYCAMDIYSLSEVGVSQQIVWEQIKEPTQLEQETSEKAGIQIIEGKRYLQELEEAMILERNKSSEIAKELKNIQNEAENLENYCRKVMTETEEANRKANQNNQNKQQTLETLFLMIKWEQMINKEITLKSKMLEDVLQKVHDYMCHQEKYYIYIYKINIQDKLDENDPRETKLKRMSDLFGEDYIKAKEAHKESLILLKQIYEKFMMVQMRVENDLTQRRREIFDQNKEYEALIFDTENDEQH